MQELLSCGQMGRADAWAIAHGVPGTVLMDKAGQAVADAIIARWSPRPVLVLCGPGNNGGDGYVAARCLRQAGWPVRVAAMVPPESLSGDALHHARLWLSLNPLADATGPLNVGALDGAELVIDALFGAGLARPLSDEVATLLQEVGRRGMPMVAVDVPSGLHGDTGQSWGAVSAALTVTFFRKKPAHVLLPGMSLCGEIVVADIGIAPGALADLQVIAWENAPALWLPDWPRPASAGHKYRRGSAVVLGGARMVGAARLASHAAARAGAGLTTLAVAAGVWPVYASGVWSTMVRSLADASDAELLCDWRALVGEPRWAALLLGPGAVAGLPGTPEETLRALVLAALAGAAGRPIVLDADALTAFAGAPSVLCDAIQLSRSPVVLTPHEGEFTRLFGQSDQDKLNRTRHAAAVSGAVVLHKGADTVVASPDGRVLVNTNAPPWLATAGAGDVLAGFITGLLAQGLPAWQAAGAAAWLHGAAAHAHGPGLLAEDLADQLPAILRTLWPEAAPQAGQVSGLS